MLATEASTAKNQWRQIRWETHLLATALEGGGAVLYLAWVGQESGPHLVLASLLSTDVVSAFVASAIAALALWPMVVRGEWFDPIRGFLFGLLVVLLASFLWFVFAVALQIGYGQFASPWRALPATGHVLISAFGGVAFLAIFQGALIFPIGITMALVAVCYGNLRARKQRRAKQEPP
jgi:hypothetical protein